MVFDIKSSTLRTKLVGFLILLTSYFKLELNAILNHDSRIMYHKQFACKVFECSVV